MTQGVILSPETYAYIDRTIKTLMASGFVRRGELRQDDMGAAWPPIICKNVSGSTIPGFGCVQVTGSVDIDGVTYLEVEDPIDPFGLAGPILFNGPYDIEADKFGEFTDGPTIRALGDGTAVTCGDGWSPQAGSFEITKRIGGNIVALATDAVRTDIVRAIYDKQPLLLRFTLNEAWSGGNADADILWPDGTDTTVDRDVYDPLSEYVDLTTGDPGWCKLQGGRLWACQAPCGSG